jgi:uncharacterized UPF0160 family protein
MFLYKKQFNIETSEKFKHRLSLMLKTLKNNSKADIMNSEITSNNKLKGKIATLAKTAHDIMSKKKNTISTTASNDANEIATMFGILEAKANGEDIEQKEYDKALFTVLDDIYKKLEVIAGSK